MEDPARAGLTKTGKPSWSTRLRTVSGSLRHCRSVTAMYGPTRSPADSKTTFMKCLSMPTADASTPAPT